MSGHAHNPGKLKQANKRHKGGKGNRAAKKEAGGKVSGASSGGAAKSSAKAAAGGSGGGKKGGANPVQQKADRMNQQMQARKSKMMETQLSKRLGSNEGPPKIVAVVPLTFIASSAEMLSLLTDANSNIAGITSYKKEATSNISYTHYSSFKSSCIYVESRERDPLEYLEICKLADVVLFVTRESLDPDINMVDDIGQETLNLVRSIGIPDVSCVVLTTDGLDLSSVMTMNAATGVVDLEDRVAKKDKEVKLSLQKFLESQLTPSLKIFDLRYIYSESVAGQGGHTTLMSLIRHVSNCTQKPLVFLNNRSYMLSENMDMDVASGPSPTGKRMVMLRGYLRGKPMQVDSLMHIAQVGSCRVVRIEQAVDPFNRRADLATAGSAMAADADPNNQESLDIEAIPDPLQGEQTWPTEEDIALATGAAGGGSARDSAIIRHGLPTGMSSYQADWLVDEEGRWQDDDDADDDDDAGGVAAEGRSEFRSLKLGGGSHVIGAGDMDDGYDELGADGLYEGASSMDDKPKRGVRFAEGTSAGGGGLAASAREDSELLEDLEFPDEVETPSDMSCRQRFSRYRCLKSFRSSSWNPMENLPESYSRIFHIENFPGIVKKSLDEHSSMERNFNKARKQNQDEEIFVAEGYARSGQFITVFLECEEEVYNSFIAVKTNRGYCSTCSLQKFENKMSVLHFTICRDKNYDGLIKNKDELIFYTGFRTFNSRPVFSEPNLNSDKHKMDRFLHPDRFTVASCLGPVTYTPTPVIVFKRIDVENSDGSVGSRLQLVATGTLTSVDPNRIVLKKVILTGIPMRTKKKSAAIKHMFYDPLDVAYYKPAELVTKLGLRGVIRSAVGTHGIFKATFDNVIKQNDTVMLVMFKRCFPKLPDAGISIK